jgi:hypothetical protein
MYMQTYAARYPDEVAGVPREGGVMLFWDTARAGFGRTTG